MAAFELPGFEVLEKLGEGGMATVWKARQLSLDRIVAIKILSSVLTEDEEDVDRFQTEARSAAKLKHQGIVQVYDADAHAGMYYFVMEYIAGYSVGDWIRRKGPLDEADILVVAESVADALAHAWEKERIVHCDIKPDNVMIDGDGTVKVADLGLARSISAVGGEDSEEVMGTPAYISPEQAMGSEGLDARADMYSLGAMMYHMATAATMFQGNSNTEAMEGQVNGQVEDVLDANPELSQGFCWLLEKLMMKDPDDRPASWEEVMEDLAQVKLGGLPTGDEPFEDLSTMMRSVERHRKVAIETEKEEAPAKSAMPLIIGLAAAVVVLILVIVILSANDKRPRQIQPPIVDTTPEKPPKQNRLEQLKGSFDYAKKWASENPDNYKGAMRKFDQVAQRAAGTKYELMARDEIAAVRKRAREHAIRLQREIRSTVQDHMDQGEYDEALAYVSDYDGPLASAIETFLQQQRAEVLSAKKEHDSSAAVIEEKRQKVAEAAIESAAKALLAGSTGVARDRIQDGVSSVEIGPSFQVLQRIDALLRKAAEQDALLFKSFEKEIGKVVSVDVVKPRPQVIKMLIDNVSPPKVSYKVKITRTATVEKSLILSDLSPTERFKRFAAAGKESDPAVALRMGMEAHQAHAMTHARRYFAQVPEIGEQLLALMDGGGASDSSGGGTSSSEDESPDAGAVEAFKSFLAREGYRVQGEPDEWREAFPQRVVTAATANVTRRRLADFSRKYEEYGDFDEVRDLIADLDEHLAKPMRRTVEAPEHTGPIFNEDQLRKAIREANHGLRNDLIRIESDHRGNVVALEIMGPELADVSPVANAPYLKHLSLNGSEARWKTVTQSEQAPLEDLSALSNLRLEELSIRNTSVSDLRPLKDMSIERLTLVSNRLRDLRALSTQYPESLTVTHSNIRDFSGIRHMTLREVNVSHTHIQDLNVLNNMPLEVVVAQGTNLRDVRPLRGAPLRVLDVRGTKIRDLSPLVDCPLEELDISETSVRSLSEIEGKELHRLGLSRLNFKDLSILEGMPIEELDVSHVDAGDFSFLAHMPLERVNLSHTNFENTRLLSGKDITHLFLSDTDVRDLTPLDGMPIEHLNLSNTKVTSISALQRSPIEVLEMKGVKVSDFEVVQHMPIEMMSYDRELHHVREILRNMTQLRRYNNEWF